MKHTVAQCVLLAAVALAGPMTAPGQTSGMAQTESLTSHTIKHRENSGDRKSTGTVSIVASKLPLSRVANQLEHQSGVPISLKGSAGDTKVTVITSESQTVHDVLRQIADAHPNLMLKQAGFESDGNRRDGYEIWENSDYRSEAAVVNVYQIKEAKATDLEDFIGPILSKNTGIVMAHERLNKLVVHDVPEKQAEVEKLIAELDKKLLTRVFALRHRDATTVARHIQQFLSLDSDQIVADEETGQVAVKGTSDTLAGVEQLVQALDVQPLAKGDKVTTSP